MEGTYEKIILLEQALEADEGKTSKNSLTLTWSQSEPAPHTLSLASLAHNKTKEYNTRYLYWRDQTLLHSQDGLSLDTQLKFPHLPHSLWWQSPLADASSYQHSYIFETFKLWALEELLEQHHPKLLTISLRNPALVSAIADFAQSRGISVRVTLPFFKTQKALNAFKASLSKPLRAFGYLLRKCREQYWIGRSQRPKKAQSIKPTALFSYVPNFDTSEAKKGTFASSYWNNLAPLLDTLLPKVWILCYVRSSELSYRETLSYVRNLDTLSSEEERFFLLEDFASPLSFLRTIASFLKLMLCGLSLRSLPSSFRSSSTSISFWCTHADVARDYFYGKSGLEACWYAAVFANLSKFIPEPGKGVYIWENCPWERALCSHWHNQFSAKLLGFQHSSVSPNDLRIQVLPELLASNSNYPLPDRILCNSPYVEQLLLRSFPQHMVGLVEAHRYTYLSPSYGSLSHRSLPATQRKLFIALDAVESIAEFQIDLLRSANPKVLERYEEIRIKAHPFNDISKKIALSSLPPQAHWVSDTADSLIQWADVSMVPNSSTIGLEVAWRGGYVLVCHFPQHLNLSPLISALEIAFVSNQIACTEQLDDPRRLCLPPDFFCFNLDYPQWRFELGLPLTEETEDGRLSNRIGAY